MMLSRASLDAFALTNPAYGSLAIYSFVKEFEQHAAHGVELALLYLPMPIAMTGSMASTFESTTAATGLLRWLARHPEVRIEVRTLLQDYRSLTRAALLFGLQRGVLYLDPAATRIRANASRLKRIPKEAAGTAISARPFSIARRLGGWCGDLGSAQTIYAALGVVS